MQRIKEALDTLKEVIGMLDKESATYDYAAIFIAYINENYMKYVPASSGLYQGMEQVRRYMRDEAAYEAFKSDIKDMLKKIYTETENMVIFHDCPVIKKEDGKIRINQAFWDDNKDNMNDYTGCIFENVELQLYDEDKEMIFQDAEFENSVIEMKAKSLDFFAGALYGCTLKNIECKKIMLQDCTIDKTSITNVKAKEMDLTLARCTNSSLEENTIETLNLNAALFDDNVNFIKNHFSRIENIDGITLRTKGDMGKMLDKLLQDIFPREVRREHHTEEAVNKIIYLEIPDVSIDDYIRIERMLYKEGARYHKCRKSITEKTGRKWFINRDRISGDKMEVFAPYIMKKGEWRHKNTVKWKREETGNDKKIENQEKIRYTEKCL